MLPFETAAVSAPAPWLGPIGSRLTGPAARSTMARIQRRPRLALAGSDRAAHVSVPARRRLGAGPVERADPRPQRRSVLDPGARRHEAAIAAAAPARIRPGAVEVAL